MKTGFATFELLGEELYALSDLLHRTHNIG